MTRETKILKCAVELLFFSVNMLNTNAGHVDCVARLIKVKRNRVNNAHPIFSETIYLSFYTSSVKIEVCLPVAVACKVAGGKRLAPAQPQYRRGST